MNIEFRQETFRDDFTFRNSPAAILDSFPSSAVGEVVRAALHRTR